jgi:predicted nucleic acid-binding protein
MSRRAVLDTSVLIAREQGRPLARQLPDEVGVSVVTLAELEVGVLVAQDGASRAQRLATLTRVREEVGGLVVDRQIASAYARLASAALAAGRRPRVNDTWIAATALVHDAELWTQDAAFTRFDGVDVVQV